MRKGKWFGMAVAFALAASLLITLVAGACAPAAPEGAAEQKPAKIHRWETGTWIGAGQLWDALNMMAEELEKMSDGRMIWTPSQPGAICAVEEQLDAVASGLTECMEPTPSYFTGKIPALFIESDAMGMTETMPQMYELYEVWEDGRIDEILNEVYVDYGNVVRVAPHYYPSNPSVIASFPLLSVDDLAGKKMRAWDWFVDVFTDLGAGGVWIPGPELYTSMATGAIDGLCYSNAPDYVDLSFHEVSTHWVRTPLMFGPSTNTLVVNGDVWDELDDDLKAMLVNVEKLASLMNYNNYALREAVTWEFVEEYGIEVVDWPADNLPRLKAAYRVAAQDRAIDDASTEIYEILERWAIAKGLWD